MSREQVLLFKPDQKSSRYDFLDEYFQTTCVAKVNDAIALVSENTYKALVCDLSHTEVVDIEQCRDLFEEEHDQSMSQVPVLILSASEDLSTKLAAFEMGVADFLGPATTPEEVCVRISKAIFHRIASEQLKDRLVMANKTAYSVMSDNSDLGTNIQFLLSINECDNLDQLGQTFFNILSHYHVSCSLQMRSVYGIKNMEANGMAKDLESQLLFQMRDSGRYVDFGRRSICNYGRVSLLIRDMPLDDERRYGAIKDNTFALVQGVDARIKALDEHIRLEHEKEALRKLSLQVKDVMQEIDHAYQSVMRDIVANVEDLADQIHKRIPTLALSEDQETFLEHVAERCVNDTNRIFNEGLKVDESFNQLSRSVDAALNEFASAEKEAELLAKDPNTGANGEAAQSNNDTVELF